MLSSACCAIAGRPIIKNRKAHRDRVISSPY
jgi:hypothetical protein